MKILFYIVLEVYLLLANELALGQGMTEKKCPEFKSEVGASYWNIKNPALSCRSVCNVDSDCVSAKDSCGRFLFFNKSYSSEVEAIIKKSTVTCQNKLDIMADFKLQCIHKRCEPSYSSCEKELKRQENYIADRIEKKCSRDEDCTFFLAPDSKCVRRFPSSKQSGASNYDLDLGFMRDAVVTACGKKQLKECDSSAKAYCISQECAVFKEKPNFKNFVNLEGPSYRPNLQSNTLPLKLPKVSESKCLNDSDCTELLGICDQYIVSLNKTFSESFKAELKKVNASISCPTTTKVQLLKSRCFKEFCSFVN